MKKPVFFILIFLLQVKVNAQVSIKDALHKTPIPYASVSFGNGQGVFADDEGQFLFTKKMYPDVDSLFISALGYKQLAIASNQLTKQVFLEEKLGELDEVVITVRPNRKYKIEKQKAYLDDDYYACWLPTIESEIAVYFENTDHRLKKINTVLFPMALESKDWKKRKRSNADKRKFSTLFKVNFYKNNNGLPGSTINDETIVFRASEQNGDGFELMVDDYNIMVPKEGFFVSLQVMGYTDHNGKLLPNKKYKEIKSKNGLVKIPTNFRPLLPFTDKIERHKTFVKRVFIHGNNWRLFKKGNGFKSNLLGQGLYNYGVGVKLKVYKED